MERTSTQSLPERALRPPALRSAIALAAVALAVLVAPTARPGDWAGTPAWDRTAHGSLVDVQVLVEGRDAPLLLAPGHWDRRYVQAFRGRHYALRITSHAGRRVGVLIAVDGLNVVSGERSSLDSGEAMYVLDPGESAVIRGWRTSLDQVRQFVFVDEERSYASRTGQANGDMGWIRVLAFEERRPVAWYDAPSLRRGDERSPRAEGGLYGRESGAAPAPPTRAQASRDAAPNAEAPTPGHPRGTSRSEVAGPAQKSLAAGPSDAYPGTGWGERREDRVQETWFVAEPTPTDHLVFRYEYADGLRALGIRLDGDRLRQRERGEFGFAQPPRW